MIKEKYKEIFRLRDMMDNAGIPYVFESGFLNGGALAYPDRANIICSAIEHDGSYGREADKIEIMGLLTEEEGKYDDVVGCLSAEEVFVRIAKHWSKNN